MWEWMRSEILEWAANWLADAFSLSPLYAEEWTLMRFINAFYWRAPWRSCWLRRRRGGLLS